MLNIPQQLTEQLKTVSEQLNQHTQDLNDSFLDVEKKLVSMRLGVSAWCSAVIGVKEEDRSGYKFGFCRINSDWRLVCRKVCLDDISDYDITVKIGYGLLKPINVMPRSVRLEASKLIEDLVSEIIRKAQEYVDDVNVAVSDIERQSKNTLTEDLDNA